MRKVNVFNSVSLDGYYTDARNDYSWAHEGANDPELMEFTKDNAQGSNALVFGRVTYDLMKAFWPTPEAAEKMPDVAKGMNAAPKLVFSRTLGVDQADWANTTVLNRDPAAEIARLKETPGPDLTVLGSGKSQFAGVEGKPRWTLARSRTFENGRVFIAYELGAAT